MGIDQNSDSENYKLSSCDLGVYLQSTSFEVSAYIPEFYSGSGKKIRNDVDEITPLPTHADQECLSSLERRLDKRIISKRNSMDRARAVLKKKASAA